MVKDYPSPGRATLECCNLVSKVLFGVLRKVLEAISVPKSAFQGNLSIGNPNNAAQRSFQAAKNVWLFFTPVFEDT